MDEDERKPIEEPSEDLKFCVDCGAQIHVRAEICPKCGIRQMEMDKKSRSDSVICPYCSVEIVPDKRVSMAGAAFFSALYIPYYYWLKNRHCPICKHDLTGADLQDYNDPDKIWKLLSAIPTILLILIGLSAIY